MKKKGSKLLGLVYLYLSKLFKKASKKIRTNIQKPGFFPWFTKGFEVFFALELLLHITTPKVITELGSGRSTHTISYFSSSKKTTFISIEQNYFFHLRNKISFKFGYLNTKHLFYVSIVNDWFDLKKINKIPNIKKTELLFLDAPGGAGNKRGRRDSLVALKFADELYDLQVLVVDDYHRKEIKNSTDDILQTRKNESTKFIINYAEVNQLLIVFFNKEQAEKFEKLSNELCFDDISLAKYK
tara:strand:- start:6760 stop:7485 length:726 start_codon:yes stop_codon:yes gene_type:complete